MISPGNPFLVFSRETSFPCFSNKQFILLVAQAKIQGFIFSLSIVSHIPRLTVWRRASRPIYGSSQVHSVSEHRIWLLISPLLSLYSLFRLLPSNFTTTIDAQHRSSSSLIKILTKMPFPCYKSIHWLSVTLIIKSKVLIMACEAL